MRERGVQSRRVRESKEAARGPVPGSSGTNAWQVIAIIALLAATAGWTTVAVIALRGPDTGAGPVAQSSTSPSDDPGAVEEESEPPLEETHDAPELEAALPAALNGVALQTQSNTGTALLTDDEWSTTVTTFLTSVGKTPADLKFAHAEDPDQSIDASVEVYQLAGVDATKLRDALVNAWKGDFPDLKLTDVTVGGKKMVRGEFDADSPASYLYVRGDELFDIWTNDEAIVAAAIAALPAPGASAAPRPSASAATSPTAATSTAP